MRSIVASLSGLPDLTLPGRTQRDRDWLVTCSLTHYVYTAWDAEGQPLYVGCTYNVARRMREHARVGAPWHAQMATLTTEAYPNRAAGREAESQRIYELRPLANIQHNPRYWEPAPDRPPTVRERKAEALRALRGGAA